VYLTIAALLTIGFAYYAVRGVDFGEMARAFRESNPWFLLAALAVLLLGFFVRVIRWRFLFSPRSRPALRPATSALLIGQCLNSVLPLRAGDAASIITLHSFAGTSRVETTGTVILARLFDVLALLLLLFAALPWLPEVTWIRAAGTLALALVIFSAALTVFLRVGGERAVRFVLRPTARLPFASEVRVEAAVRNLTEGVIALRSARVGFVAFVWTVVSWLVLGASFWLALLAFDIELSPVAGLFVVIATSLSLVLPAAPASLGVFEAAAVVALGAYDVPRSEALSVGLVVHALGVVPFIIAGLFLFSAHRGVLGGTAWREPTESG
jgi:uncharacterized protein (TIRG00374 family)